MTTVFLAAAQDTQQPKPASQSNFFQNLFSPKAATLAKLVDEKKLLDADDYLGKERQYFWVDEKKNQLELLRRLGSAFNEGFEPQIDSAIASLNAGAEIKREQWPEYSRSIKVADSVVTEYKKLQIFTEPDFRSPKLLTLETALTSAKVNLANAGSLAFEQFDHASPDNFFALYPTQLPDTFLSDSAPMLKDFAKRLTADQTLQIKSKYPEKIGNSGSFNEMLGERFLEVNLPASAPPPSIGQVLAVLKNAKSAGFPVKNVPAAKIAFVEVTSKTLLSEGQIEFPTQVDMDLPFDPVKSDVDSVLDTTAKIGANFIIILDVAASKVSRRILAKEDLSSKFVSGVRSDPNPAYDVARNRVFEVQNGLANARSQPSNGLAAALINGIAIGLWNKRFTEAQQELTSTPMMLKTEEFQSYNYSASNIATTRAMTANYYVIDRTKNRYFKGIFDVSENKAFRITYNLHDKDPDRGSILSKFSKESEITTYEQSPMSVPVSLLIADYLKNEAQSKPLQSLIALRDEMLEDKNKALTTYKSTQYTAKATNDPRFDSVVVMNNPKGALGTGFFVAPDLILTNYHVVEGAQFVEMKLYNGMETFGKVVKSDVRLDLALVKVQTRGTPVNFFQGNVLDLGATVEAIGHPKGLTFTITRGVVSAVRKRPSIFGVGGKEVLFVQTDTAINPGNSGGPLFLGDKVIGVNNNKMVAGSEGLGFSIHYSEVKEFLKESF